MQKCPKCGYRLKGYEMFCPNCGIDIVAYQQRSQKAARSGVKSDQGAHVDPYLDHLDNSLSDSSLLSKASTQSFNSATLSSSSSAASRSIKSASTVQRLLRSSQPRSRHLPQRVPVAQQSLVETRRQYSSRGRYWQWWWQSIQHPLRTNVNHRRPFGFISFLMEWILWALAFRSLMSQAVNEILTALFHDQPSGNVMIFENSDGSWWGLLTLGGLSILCYWLIGYWLSGSRQHAVSFNAYGNHLAALTNVNLPIELVLLGLTWLDINDLAMLVFGTVLLIAGAGLVISIFEPQPASVKDQTYRAAFAVVLVPIVILVFFELILEIIS